MVCVLPALFRQRQSAAGGTSVQADKIVGPGDMWAQLEQTFKNSNVTDYQAFSQRSDVRMRSWHAEGDADRRRTVMT
jgi:hypothetical protein